MPNSEELIKIREETIENYKQNYKIEQFLLENAQEYYDTFLNSNLTWQANKNLKEDKISARGSGIFITTSNEKIARLFFNQISTEDLEYFTYEDIDNISTKKNPIIYIDEYNYDNYKNYTYFTRLSYIKKLVEVDKYDFKVKVENTPDAYGNLFIAFEASIKVPKLAFSDQKVLIKKN